MHTQTERTSNGENDSYLRSMNQKSFQKCSSFYKRVFKIYPKTASHLFWGTYLCRNVPGNLLVFFVFRCQYIFHTLHSFSNSNLCIICFGVGWRFFVDLVAFPSPYKDLFAGKSFHFYPDQRFLKEYILRFSSTMYCSLSFSRRLHLYFVEYYYIFPPFNFTTKHFTSTFN